MSEAFQVSLTRASSSQPWGFRLQGGTDFSTPLSVQSVNPGSIAEQCGLRPGDAILQIGNRQSDEMTHEDAKTQILLAGNNVTLLVKRGAVKIWQPKVTPLSELRGEPQPLPTGGEEQFVQKTSLAADKTAAPEINFFNRSARPFPGFGGASGSEKVPVVMNAQYNTPIGMYSTSAALEAFEQQSAALVGDVASVSLDEKDKQELNNNNNDNSKNPSEHVVMTTTVTKNQNITQDTRSKSPNYLLAENNNNEPYTVACGMEDNVDGLQKRGISPTLLAVHEEERHGSSLGAGALSRLGENLDKPATVTRSISPTLLAVQEEDKSKSSSGSGTSGASEANLDHCGYNDPNKQSRSLKLLQQDLLIADVQGSPAASSDRPAGIRSVKAPTGPPPNVQVQQAQHMTCKVCGSLIIGVFVKVKGEPMHAECYKCVRCGKSLKNQGFFTVEGQMHCEACARSQPPGQNMTATAVYR